MLFCILFFKDSGREPLISACSPSSYHCLCHRCPADMLHTLIATAAGCAFFSSTVQASPFQIFNKRAATALAGYTNQGCYTEATNGRALTGNAYFSDSMTVEKCAAACSSFAWFGVEYGRECYCGDSTNPGSVSTADSDCSFTCPGNSAETCGAGYRLNMYQKASDKTKSGGSDKTTSASATASTSSTDTKPGKFTAKGCYTEATNGRALISKTYYDDAMTVEKCASACSAYTYFGVEYYRECYCGNNFQAGSNPAPASDCNHPCGGDSSELCGGDNRLNVYTFGEKTSDPAPAKTSVGDYNFDGCYTEATNSRALIGGVYYDDAMTVEKCAAVCSGYTLFGVEYARECRLSFPEHLLHLGPL